MDHSSHSFTAVAAVAVIIYALAASVAAVAVAMAAVAVAVAVAAVAVPSRIAPPFTKNGHGTHGPQRYPAGLKSGTRCRLCPE